MPLTLKPKLRKPTEEEISGMEKLIHYAIDGLASSVLNLEDVQAGLSWLSDAGVRL